MSTNSEPELESHRARSVRLQKVLAAAGIGSRRASEQLIAAGRVHVNEELARLGMRVDPQTALITVDGRRINIRDDLVYVAVNKPRGVLSAMSDSRGRATIGELVAGRAGRLFHVGRLDADSEGLLLLTNDGELAHRLMHPSYGVVKTYLAEVPAPIPRGLGRQLRSGVQLTDGLVQVDAFHVVQAEGDHALVEVQLHEGRKHVVRRLLAEVGHPVSRLVRTAIGPIVLGGQPPGSVRPLTWGEVSALQQLVDK